MPQQSLHTAQSLPRHTAQANIASTNLPQYQNPLNYPLLGRVAVFSTKVKNLLKFDAPDLDASDPFPFLFNGDDMDGGPDTKLRVFPASDLTDGATMAVETNVSTYAIPARGTLTHLIPYGAQGLPSKQPAHSAMIAMLTRERRLREAQTLLETVARGDEGSH
jgi:hypothetical protein